MLFFLIASLISTVAAGETCSAGRCLAEEVSTRVAQADDVLDPAVGLVQTALHAKRRDQKVVEVAHGQVNESSATLAIRQVGELKSHATHAAFTPCLLTGDEYLSVPFSTKGLLENKAFQALGLVRPQLSCEQPDLAVFSSFADGTDVEGQNRMAMYVILAWSVVSVVLVVWSVYSVLIIARKKDFDLAKTNLADEDKAWSRGFFYWVSLSWVDELVGRYGKCTHSVIDDKEVVVNRSDDNYTPYITFRKHWNDEIAKKGGVENASLLRPLYLTVGFKALACLVTCIIIEELFSTVMMVFALDRFLTTLERINQMREMNPGQPISLLEPTLQIVVLLWGVPMVFRTTSIVVNLLDGYYTNMCASGLASIVFEKALNSPLGVAMPQNSRQAPTSLDDEAPDPQGKEKPNVIQLLNVDIIEVWGSLIRDSVYAVISPFTMIALLGIMIKQIRTAGAVGACYIVPCLILFFLVAMWNLSWWKRYQSFQDRRLKFLTEAILHIRTIKALAWEKLSFQKLNIAREAELKCNQRCAIIGGCMGAVGHTLPWGVLLISLWFLLAKEGSVEAHKIIVIQRIIGSLLGCLGQFVTGMHKMVNVPNSFGRIKRFLATENRPDIVRQPTIASPNAPVLRMKGSFTYSQDQDPALKDLDIAIPKGELVGVIGAVASGKSTLLQAMIGELYALDDAFVEAPMPGSGRVAYCAQVPWIFEGTLRENVMLNDNALQHDRYYKSLYAAGLTQDLQILPGGDQVTIGSYGIRLSGGQRARVALARAAYMEQAEVVIIDDPFASVDLPTGQHICEELLLGPIMRNRTRIVVLQPNPQRLSMFDRVLLMEGGKVVEMGPPAEVMESKAFQRLQTDVKGSETMEVDGQVEAVSRGGDGGTAMLLAKKAGETATALRDTEGQDHVTWSTIWWWVKAAGFMNIAVFVCSVAIQRCVELRESLVVAVWIDTKMSQPTVDDHIFMVRCAVVVAACCFCIVVAAYACSCVSISASRKIHHSVMSSLLRAPIDKFFDKQPIGRLINRLSFDMRQVDDAVTAVLFYMLTFLCGFFVTQSFILHVMPTKIALCAVPLYICTWLFIWLYRGLAVPLVFHSKFSLSNLQDLQAIVLGQCVSIRANGMHDYFMMRYNHYSQSVIRSQYLIFHVCRAWVQSRVFICFGALTGLFAIGGLWSGMPMGTLSMVISFSFAQMTDFENMALGFTMLLNVLNALQRLMKYMNVPQEAEADLPNDPVVRRRVKVERSELLQLEMKRSNDGKALAIGLRGEQPILQQSADGISLELLPGKSLSDLAPSCEALGKLKVDYHIIAVNNVSKSAERMAQELVSPPSVLWLDLWCSEFAQGMGVQLEDLSAGYGNEKSVLHGINLEIEPRAKCGFAGKTGCGKSSTLLCILRLLEPRYGRILVGGRDTSKLGLSCLRSIVGLVPQDPTVFEGSWRFNIDPFGEFPDARIWEALQCVQLMPYLRTLPDGIDSELSRDGANLSFGQRQLLSLARMVVRQPPVLLLDECTSALDPNTQEAVQKTLLNDFPMSTVIAIAHRIETILDFDKIIVFDEGHVAEQGTVKEVSNIENGIFAKMLKTHRGSFRRSQ